MIGSAVYFFDDGTLEPAWELLPETVDLSVYFHSEPIIGSIVGLAVGLLFLASIAGVLLFRNWGRWLYLTVSLLMLLVSAFTGPTIYYGWERALWDVLQMVNGAIILAMFLPPISNEFNKLSQQDAKNYAVA
jgi:hypothetical protein